MTPTYEQMGGWLEEIVAQFPEPFFEGLSGGIQLERELRGDKRFPGRGLCVMGEYRHDMLGRYIRLYYGSFLKMLSHEDEQVWRQQIFDTVAHEFTHHMEETAGLHALEDKDKEFLQRIMEQERRWRKGEREDGRQDNR